MTITLRNLSREVITIESPALGSVDHEVGFAPLDRSGARVPQTVAKSLARSVTLQPTAMPRAPLTDAIARAEAVTGLPDALEDDPHVATLLVSKTISIQKDTDQ